MECIVLGGRKGTGSEESNSAGNNYALGEVLACFTAAILLAG